VRKEIDLRLPDLPVDARFVMAEPRMLANQVFANLVSNAIKFSRPGGSIVVAVARERDHVALSVTDRGIGIPAALLARLFDLEAKTSRRGTAGEPGTGFGMRTVKYFVELFGGQLEVESRSEDEHPDQHGTTVRVRLRAAGEARVVTAPAAGTVV
jgi:signal transduction histidine kinase